MALSIPEINDLSTGIEMKKEVLKRAIEGGITENDVWQEIEIYRKRAKRQNPVSVKEIISQILNKYKKEGNK